MGFFAAIAVWVVASLGLPAAAHADLNSIGAMMKTVETFINTSPQLEAHYPKSPSCSYAAMSDQAGTFLQDEFNAERATFQKAEATLKKIPTLPSPIIQARCKGASDPAACKAACTATWGRGYQDGMSKIHPWTRNLSLDDGFATDPAALDAELKQHEQQRKGFNAAWTKKFFTTSPCSNAAELTDRALAGKPESVRKQARAAALQCCFAGFQNGRETLRDILDVKELGPSATPKARGYLCDQDYQRGRVVGAQLCLLYERAVRQIEVAAVQLPIPGPQSDPLCTEGSCKIRSETGEGAQTLKIDTCSPVPNTSCVPICHALGIESTLHGRNAKGGYVCEAYSRYWSDPVLSQKLPAHMNPRLNLRNASKPDKPYTDVPGTPSNAQGGN